MKKKIVFCLNDFLPNQVAGTELYVFSLATQMKNKGYDVLVLIPNFNKNVNESYYYESIKVVKFSECTALNRGVIAGEIIPNGVSIFAKIIKDEKPNIVHFHTVGGSNGISIHHMRAIKKLSISIVTTFHLAGYTCNTNNLLFENKVPCNGFIDVLKCTKCAYSNKGMGIYKKNILYRFASVAFSLNYNTRTWNNALGTAIGYPFLIKKMQSNLREIAELSNKIIVLTKWYKNVLELNGLLAQKLHFISQGLASDYVSKNNIDVINGLKLVFVGRLNESKGLHLLLNVITKMVGQNITLDIYGPETDEIYVAKWKRYTAFNMQIKWKGIIAPSEIMNTLSNYNILCLPSLICEMSPLVIQEAFAAGIPVIASNVYGNAEQIIDNKNGWLFKFNDENHLKEILQKLNDNPSLIKAASEQITAVKPFSIVATEHDDLYKQVLKV